MPKKAKFKVGQIVVSRVTGQPVKILSVWPPQDKKDAWWKEWHYYLLDEWEHSESQLRPQTKREKGD